MDHKDRQENAFGSTEVRQSRWDNTQNHASSQGPHFRNSSYQPRSFPLNE